MTPGEEAIDNFIELFEGRTDAYGAWTGGSIPAQHLSHGLTNPLCDHLCDGVYIGVYPQPFLDTSAATMHGVQQWFGTAFSQLASAR